MRHWQPICFGMGAALDSWLAPGPKTPPGHPDGFIEAFSNIYLNIAEAIIYNRNGKDLPNNVYFPNFYDGIEGMKFIEAAIESNANNCIWVPFIST